jgi:vancomycin resistance protein YoaR
LKVDKPKITTKKLKKYLFRDVLGSCTTDVGGTADRVSNVSLAAEKINGTILLPGESFSYNNVVGERTAARGFKKAPAYSNGQSVQELGGGICQVSSTLYKAVLLSNLKIDEHHNHSYVSNYIGIGMDATVSWNGPDFQFSNNTDYPIKIVAGYSGGQVTCKIVGAKLDGNTVEMTADTLQITSCDTVYQDDASLEKGVTEVVSSGHDGYVVQTYRNIYDKDGNRISTTKEAYCVYRTQDRVVRVGTKETGSETTDGEETDTEGQE